MSQTRVFAARVAGKFASQDECFYLGSAMNELSSAVAVLTAMITPAVLISACGTMILSTSHRLGRVVDRVRALSDRFEEIAHTSGDDAANLELFDERRAVIFDQLDRLIARARLLQKCMTIFYTALGVFVLTSVLIGIVVATGTSYTWLPVVAGLGGALCLFYGSVLLIIEARMNLRALGSELDFIWHLNTRLAPENLVEEHDRPSGSRLARTMQNVREHRLKMSGSK